MSALERRGLNMARIGATMPQVLEGLDPIMVSWEHALAHSTSKEIASIVRRVVEELGILVDAVLAEHHAPVNADRRAMLEAWALLTLFAEQPGRTKAWRLASGTPGNTDFNFPKVLRQLDAHKALTKGDNLPELGEYNAHSLSSHISYIEEGVEFHPAPMPFRFFTFTTLTDMRAISRQQWLVCMRGSRNCFRLRVGAPTPARS